MKKKLKVLMVDDSADDAALVLRELSRGGFAVDHTLVQTSEDMRAALCGEPWDLVLCDYSMPQFDALRALALVGEIAWPGPMLIVSGTIGEERAVECMRAGASDLILKDKLARLVPAVERELASYARRVEQERTQQQLQRAEGALARSEKLRIIGQMTAGISHDLRNLLHPICLYADLIHNALEAHDAAQADECLLELRQVVERGLELVNRLREFSRPTLEKQSSSVDLNRAAREAMGVVRPRAFSNEARVSLREELGTAPQVRADLSDLVSALVNLLTNAIDAAARTVTIRTGAVDSSAWIEVSDDGPGMSSDVKEHVFEPFFTTKGEKGTGLGLAMVHAAALRHEGTVDLDSSPGHGTRIRLSFPLPRGGVDTAAE